MGIDEIRKIQAESGRATRGMKIGMIVHYLSYGTPAGEYPKACRAAIVTQENRDGTVDLAVLNPAGIFFNQSVALDAAGNRGGTWHTGEHP